MAYTNDWSNSIPVDHTKFKSVPGSVRQLRIDIEDRLVDLFYGFDSGDVVETEGAKTLPFVNQGADPGATANKIKAYGNQISSKTELFLQDEDGNVIQVTSKGKINLGNARIPNNVQLIGRNAAGAADINLIKVNASDVPEIPNGAVLSSTAAPTTDPMIANKKYVDDKIAAIPAPIGFGTRASKTAGTVYQAATDGFVTGYATASSINCGFQILCDTSPSPSTSMIGGYGTWVSGAPNVKLPISFPVKKGEYYQVIGQKGDGPSTDNTVIQALYFTPWGT